MLRKRRSEQQLRPPGGGCYPVAWPNWLGTSLQSCLRRKLPYGFESRRHLDCLRIFGSRDTVSPTGNSGLLRCRIFGFGSRKVRAAPPIPAGDRKIVRTAKHSLRSSVGRAATASRHPSGVVLWMSGSRHRQIVVTFGGAGELPGGNRTRLTAVFRTHL